MVHSSVTDKIKYQFIPKTLTFIFYKFSYAIYGIIIADNYVGRFVPA